MPGNLQKLSLGFPIAVSILFHIFILTAVNPYTARPFRSIGIKVRLEVQAHGSDGRVLGAITPKSIKVAPLASQSKESPPSRTARRAVILSTVDFGLQPELSQPDLLDDGHHELLGLFSLHIPKSPDKYFSANEVDIRAEPIGDLIPFGLAPEALGSTRSYLKIRLLIDETGKVTQLDVLDSFPKGFLESTAPDYLREVIFLPARINGQTVKSQKIIELSYSPVSDS